MYGIKQWGFFSVLYLAIFTKGIRFKMTFKDSLLCFIIYLVFREVFYHKHELRNNVSTKIHWSWVIYQTLLLKTSVWRRGRLLMHCFVHLLSSNPLLFASHTLENNPSCHQHNSLTAKSLLDKVQKIRTSSFFLFFYTPS